MREREAQELDSSPYNLEGMVYTLRSENYLWVLAPLSYSVNEIEYLNKVYLNKGIQFRRPTIEPNPKDLAELPKRETEIDDETSNWKTLGEYFQAMQRDFNIKLYFDQTEIKEGFIIKVKTFRSQKQEAADFGIFVPEGNDPDVAIQSWIEIKSICGVEIDDSSI